MIAIHRGLTTKIREQMQKTGVRMEDSDAARLVAGKAVIGGFPYKIALETVEAVFRSRHEHMKRWEEDHPGVTPFPPLFPEVVLSLLRNIDVENPHETIATVIKLAEEELDLL